VCEGPQRDRTRFSGFDRVGYDADIDGTAREFGVTPTRLGDWASIQRPVPA
jgi:hypothetical protein